MEAPAALFSAHHVPAGEFTTIVADEKPSIDRAVSAGAHDEAPCRGIKAAVEGDCEV